MPTVVKEDDKHWIVYLNPRDEADVTVVVNMNAETARRIAQRETERIAALNPGRADIDSESAGSAVMSVLELYSLGWKP